MPNVTENNRLKLRTDQPHWRRRVMLGGGLTGVFCSISCVRHTPVTGPGPGAYLAGRVAPPKHVSGAKFRVTRRVGTPIRRPCGAGPSCRISWREIANGHFCDGFNGTLSSSACGVGAAQLHACSPDWIAETGHGRSKGRVGRTLGLSGRWCDRSWSCSVRSARIVPDLSGLIFGI